MDNAIASYEIRGGFRVQVEADIDPSNPRTEYDGDVLRLVPLEALGREGRMSGHLESLGFDGPHELPGLDDAWERLGGESGEVWRANPGEGPLWIPQPGWPALDDFGATPVARWARIFHGVELETVEAGENRAVAWVDLELVGQYGMPAPEDRAGALGMIASNLAPYNAWAAGEVYGVVIEDKDGDELGSCWGFYFDPYNELEVLGEAAGYCGGKPERRIRERLEVVRELDALRKRLHRAESRERWERQRGEARVIEARGVTGAETFRKAVRAVDALASGMVTADEAREVLEREAVRGDVFAAAGKRDAERAAGYLAGLNR